MSRKTNNRQNILVHRLLLSVLCCLFGFCLWAEVVQSPSPAQKPMKVTLLHADRTVQRASNKNLQMLIGNVEFLYDSIYMNCDTAYNYNNRNYFEAFGNVRMNQGDTLFLYGDYLDYDGDSRLVRVRHNVRMENRNVVLLTDSLNYDRERNLGYYFNGGTLEDSTNVLSSEWGEYNPQTKMAVFNYDVELVNSQFTLVSDTLRYSTDTRIANIVGPSDIESGESYIYSESGFYNTAERKAYLLDRSVLTNKSNQLVGDSIFYDETLKYGEAFGRVEMNDTLDKVMLLGEYCYSNELTGYAYATDSAVAIDYSQGDSLFMHGDTLKLVTFHIDTDSMYRQVQAYRQVRFYRADIQGACDSLIFSSVDSCLTMYYDPVLWNAGQQLLGEEIRIYMNDSTVDWAHIINQALTVEQKDSIHYNQVAGREMKFYFDGTDIYKAEVTGNVQSIFYPENEDSIMMGMNFIEASKLNLYRKDGKMERIVFITKPTGTFTPMFLLDPQKMKLESFVWLAYMRPKSKEDIFQPRGKKAGEQLKKIIRREVPLPTLE
ncbi:MAG: hypothetical protein IJZ45_01835 [Bacteroidaceae bacterium]|nr:hypothetical protein [Bacteroidaceae bacterium]